MELIKFSGNTYYIKNAVNIGVIKTSENKVCLIDSGADKDTGKKVLRLLEAEGLEVEYIISTHSHADHIGANRFIKEKTGCKIFANKAEVPFCNYTYFEPAFLWGSLPFEEIKSKFLLAQECETRDISQLDLPSSLEIIPLPGHCFDMIGVKTEDGVFFAADALFSERTAEKYHFCYIYDVKAYLETLEVLKNTQARLFVPAHCEASEDITSLCEINKNKVLSICEDILGICAQAKMFEDILKEVFDKYSLVMNATQYFLVGNTLKGYLTYLKNENRLTFFFEDNKMLWKKNED